MKKWFCEFCARREESDDDIIIKFCASCIEEMIREDEENAS